MVGDYILFRTFPTGLGNTQKSKPNPTANGLCYSLVTAASLIVVLWAHRWGLMSGPMLTCCRHWGDVQIYVVLNFCVYSKSLSSTMSQHTRKSPYSRLQRPLGAAKIKSEDESDIASHDPPKARLRELLQELQIANGEGRMLTYDIAKQGWTEWFR